MNQYVKDALVTYHSKPHTIKAVKYEEGMEDGWVIQIDGHGYVQKIFKSKKKANKYIKKHSDENVIFGVPIPVFANEITESWYEASCDYGYAIDVIRHNGKLYQYEEIVVCDEDTWLILEPDDESLCYEFNENFLDKYEKGDISIASEINVSDVKILYNAYRSLCKCVQKKVYCEACPLYYGGCSGGQYQEDVDVEKFHNALDRIRDTINRK